MKKALIIGAGPAGLTAAYELLTKTSIIPIIIEKGAQVGGLSKTINHNGNLLDIGGHRFFSKHKAIIDWWLNILPLEDLRENKRDVELSYQNKKVLMEVSSLLSREKDNVMLLRQRKSRIYYNNNFFDYPLKLNWNTLSNLGVKKIIKISFSYTYAKLFPIRPEHSLGDFFHNRFGSDLYQTFFKSYTEKVWGVPCADMPATWGHQRIKKLNVTRTLLNSFSSLFYKDRSLSQTDTDTSLIQQFLYPKFGPGQLWEEVAEKIKSLGGSIVLNTEVSKINFNLDDKSFNLEGICKDGTKLLMYADYCFSTMPIKELINKFNQFNIPDRIQGIANGLKYRDFMIVGILADVSKNGLSEKKIDDNWIYIQDSNIRAGRVQFFNNWSPNMVENPSHSWIGVEYFVNSTDDFWQQEDTKIKDIAISEMIKVGLVEKGTVIDSVVVREEKAYPSYDGTYKNFDEIISFLDEIENLYLIGRNGMHRYNNTDHSMLTAMEAVANIINNKTTKSNIWDINTEDDYHEEK